MHWITKFQNGDRKINKNKHLHDEVYRSVPWFSDVGFSNFIYKEVAKLSKVMFSMMRVICFSDQRII